VLKSRGRGSHVVMAKEGAPGILTIPQRKAIRRGTLRGR
jgi:predicted RNA binding protein YcfA (HicA-like mRNA interferase family)